MTPMSDALKRLKELTSKISSYELTRKENFKRLQELFKKLELEKMESFSVLAVAKTFGIPAGGVFCVSNFCDRNAHEDFLKNQPRAKEFLTKYMKEKGVLK